MRTTAIAAFGVLATAASIGLAAPASTDVLNQFSQPGGNVNCVMGTENGGQYYAACQINKFSYQPPPRSGACPGWGNLFWLDQGNPAYLKCDGGPLIYPTPPPLGWEQTQSLGPLLCQNSNENPSLPPSTLCKDNSSSHHFRIYPDHYLLG